MLSVQRARCAFVCALAGLSLLGSVAFAAPAGSNSRHLEMLQRQQSTSLLTDTQSNVLNFRGPQSEELARAPHRSMSVIWQMRFGGGEGVALALLDAAHDSVPPADTSWDEPNLPHAFAIAFDARNPPTENPFNADGNIYNRPQHEISLHWNGLEIANRLSPRDFRGDAWHTIHVNLGFVVGGANLSVSVDGVAAYQDYFVAGLQPFAARAVLGARAGQTKGQCEVRDIVLNCGPRVTVDAPLHLAALDKQVVKEKVPSQSNMVDFPTDTRQYGRIILTLTLSEPPGGFDPWDRRAAIYLYDDKGERFELLRFITPYRRGYTWRADVSDFRPLLTGRKKVEAWCETYGPGYAVSVDFDFYQGAAPLYAYKVVNLWHGDPEIGNPAQPISAFFKPVSIAREGADALKLRVVTTGHGMEPNAGNAAEFLPIGRNVTLNGHRWDNTLWKTDNYLNPCRPQGGTWKYDRAGWGPGDVVVPWSVDLTPALTSKGDSLLRYTLAPYANPTRKPDFPPSHWFESQLIFYRKG